MEFKPKPKSELDQLHELGDAKLGRGNKGKPASSAFSASRTMAAGRFGSGAPPAAQRLPLGAAAERRGFDSVPIERSAAMGHRANDRYMQDWDTAYEELQAGSSAVAGHDAGGGNARLSAGSSRSGGSAGYLRYDSAAAAGGVHASSHALRSTITAASTGARRTQTTISVMDDAGSAASGAVRRVVTSPLGQPQVQISPHWYRGPVDPAGRLVDLSDRPTMCMAVTGLEAACGNSDHAVYGVDLQRGCKSKSLYGGKYGHGEWVTSVCYVGDGSGRVVSAGMDGKICLWSTKPVGRQFTCSDLIGHFGSVSLVASPGGGTSACGPASGAFGSYVVSGGYDKTVRLWDCSAAGGGACVMTSKSHSAPVLSMALHATNSEFWGVTGDRDGVANVWRLHDGVCVGSLRGHKGHLTACAWLADPVAVDADGTGAGAASGTGSDAGNLIVTGAQDGHVRVWDVRTRSCVANIAAHASPSGSGAVGDIAVARVSSPLPAASSASQSAAASASSEPLVVTSGADKRICVLDPRKGFEVRTAFTVHKDFIYSLTVVGNLCFSGSGDGLLYCHDLASGRILWAVGAGMAAIRCIGAAGKHLIASGDDGKAIIYDF